MNGERDPRLERLFADASRDLSDEAFIGGVLAEAARRRRHGRIVMIGGGLVAIVALWLVSAPLGDLLRWLAELLWQPLTGFSGFAAPILGPVDTVAGALVLALVVLRAILRKLFS